MPCLDAARTSTNARATTSGGRSACGGHHAPTTRASFSARRHHRRGALSFPFRLPLIPSAVPPNGSDVSREVLDSSAAAAAAIAAAAATAGAGTASASPSSRFASSTTTAGDDSFAATAPVLQRDSAFAVLICRREQRALLPRHSLALLEKCRETQGESCPVSKRLGMPLVFFSSSPPFTHLSLALPPLRPLQKKKKKNQKLKTQQATPTSSRTSAPRPRTSPTTETRPWSCCFPER